MFHRALIYKKLKEGWGKQEPKLMQVLVYLVPLPNGINQTQWTVLSKENIWVKVTKHSFLLEPFLVTWCWHGRLCRQCAYFPKSHKLCGSLLCQGFLSEILICLPSRLWSGFSFVCYELCSRWGNASLGIISISGYSQLFLLIQYQNNTLYNHTPPSSSKQQCWGSSNCASQSQFSLPVTLPLPWAYLQHFWNYHFIFLGEHTQSTHSTHSFREKKCW